jgi:chaperonin GroEL
VATAALRAQARPIDGPADIARLIAGSLGDADLADRLGEAVDAAGPDGAVLVEDTQATRTSVEYIDGVRWNAGFVSSFLLAPGEATTSRLMNPRVLVTDYILERADDLVPTLEACVAAGERSLFVVAPDVRDAAVGLLAANRQRGVIDAVAAVKAPSYGAVRDGILGDIAAITGGRCLWQARGDRLADVQISDLGRARQAWASHVAFGILGGHGSKDTIRQRVADAKAELKAERDDYTRRMLHARIGQLLGTVATVHVGAATPAEQAELKLRVEAVVRASRSALQEGVVPGAGAAYLACTPALAPALADVPPDEAVGVQALLDALAEPMRTILCNAGLDAAPLLHRARCDTRHVYDALAQQWVDPWQAGLLDPLAVTLAALETSVSMALTALASEVLVRRQHPVRAVEP